MKIKFTLRSKSIPHTHAHALPPAPPGPQALNHEWGQTPTLCRNETRPGGMAYNAASLITWAVASLNLQTPARSVFSLHVWLISQLRVPPVIQNLFCGDAQLETGSSSKCEIISMSCILGFTTHKSSTSQTSATNNGVDSSAVNKSLAPSWFLFAYLLHLSASHYPASFNIGQR